MLSKEEIEKGKKEGYEIIGNFKSATTEITKDIFPKKAKAIETLLQYIEQLENKIKVKDESIKELGQVVKDMCSDKQKLIEKLEEDVEYGESFKTDDLEPTIPEIRAEYAQEILSIVKGEKNE